MSRHSPNQAERGFFDAISSDRPLTKRAAELDPMTAEILGVQSVSPAVLQSLEGGTRPARPRMRQPGEEPAAAEAPPDELAANDELAQAPPQDLEAFDRFDAEPAITEDTPVEPELPSRLTHGKLFTDKRAHPLQIYDVLCMRYQQDWTEWEPETLWWALRRDFGPIGEVTRNKIMALRLAATTDAPWLDWDTFENSTLAWNDIVPLFGAYQPTTPMQTALGVEVLRTIRGDEEFSWEVKVYIAAILEDNGFVYAPEEWFDGAQEVMYRKDWMFSLKAEVAAAWEKVKDTDPTQIEWDDTDQLHVHLLKLAVVKRYLAERAAVREKVPGGGRSRAGVSPPVPA